MWMMYTGTWIVDVMISADSLLTLPLPKGPCVLLFGGVPMQGTIDAGSSGTFGPTGRVRVIGGGNGWGQNPTILTLPSNDFHSDGGLVSTTVFSAVALAMKEKLVDLKPRVLGTDFVVSYNNPAMQVFGDDAWFVDVTGTTYHGPRLPSIADLSLVITDFEPVSRKITFSCNTLLIPGTPMVDARFGTQTFLAYNVEQIFDDQGSTGWAWLSTPPLPGLPLTAPTSIIVDELKAATLYWTRAGFLRVYRYNLVVYAGDGPAGGPSRMALQAATITPGIPTLIPLQPWSGVAGVVSMLAPGQQVLVVFENADPSLPRVISYSLVAQGGQPLGLPLQTQHDASVELDFGLTCPLVNIGKMAAMVNIAGGTDFLVKATEYAAALAAIEAAGNAMQAAVTPPPVTLLQVAASCVALGAAGQAMATALAGIPLAATLITKAT
jgi:hypothetical protein